MTLTLLELYTDIYEKTGLTTSDIGVSTILPWINQRTNRLYEVVGEVNEDFLGTTTTTSMTSGVADFALPTTLMKVKRVEATYNGSTWRQAQAIDINQITEATDTSTDNSNFSSADPKYELFGTTLTLHPAATANVTNGFKMWYISRPSALAQNADTPNIALQGFEHLISAGAIVDIATKLELKELVGKYAAEWEEGVSSMRRQLQNRSLDENLSFAPIKESY